jgi:hypothetical protein
MRATLATRARSKRVVKDWLALICAIPIRSLRTKWSRMKNEADGGLRLRLIRPTLAARPLARRVGFS